MTPAKITVSALALLAASAATAAAQEQIQVAGSSTVLPYATIVAEAFAENTDFPAPVVEGGGSGAGLKQFCAGVGQNTIDVANASRPIKASELEECRANGVENVMEVQFGYDGIVFASSINGPDFVLTPADIYRALAAEVVMDGATVANPAMTWADVNPALPAQQITVFVPGTKHGTREVFEEKVMAAGCEASGDLEEMTGLADADTAEAACTALRTDGRSIDIDGDYTETLARINSDPNGIGVFGLSFYENNTDKLKVATIDGVAPSVETVASGEYPVSRPLFFYVKKDHFGTVPGLKEYAEFFVADAIAGPGGPLADYGLVPDPELAAVQSAIADETVLSAAN
ncbi:phosphonate ABC transporter substrate-binding protein [Paracoccus sp. S-4012]|uniref:PstS family phosphate ABC transporter substrate-binding protein n=1 Tax=Paracoccus sp. S-4012 TaxID=2665648 RepID=UPI0012B11269|nr:substrate-binding domain-containing protein [Paracoccus sp. S-4012]MRX49189.1 phosphonate ABC transporter substrate-binding protein [Paracoccus sp. S-4012]